MRSRLGLTTLARAPRRRNGNTEREPGPQIAAIWERNRIPWNPGRRRSPSVESQSFTVGEEDGKEEWDAAAWGQCVSDWKGQGARAWAGEPRWLLAGRVQWGELELGRARGKTGEGHWAAGNAGPVLLLLRWLRLLFFFFFNSFFPRKLLSKIDKIKTKHQHQKYHTPA